MRRRRLLCLLLGVLLIGGCAAPKPSAPAAGGPPLKAANLAGGRKLKVMATTSILGDLVRNVGGDKVDVSTLLSPDADPHAFQPTPQDAKRVSQSDAILANGAGLETFLAPLLTNAGAQVSVVDLSAGVPLRMVAGEGGAQNGADPHIWTSPANAITMTLNIARALDTLDPANAATYDGNAAAYAAQLRDLDQWVSGQFASLAPERRKLVVSHDSLGYYADRYGLQLIGAIIPGFSSLSEPSAQQVGALEDAIRKNQVSTIFVENTVNPALSDRVAQDVGVKVVKLYSDALGAPGSGAETYIAYVRTNTAAIVNALK
jgi:ABC-type Zn uptake system ZnuABC Zn-binding protein ZnuA